MKFATRAVHAGFTPDKETGAIMPPIYMTSTFLQEAPGVNSGYEYTRAHNPNFTILESLTASLENGLHATVFSSGIGALTAFMATLKPGAKVAAIGALYGGSFRLMTRFFSKWGISFATFGADELEKALQDKPDWLMFETPTNPLMEIIDIKASVKAAKIAGTKVIVDNTFASACLQNPLDLGADVVWHSATKYLGGHSDVIGGCIVTNDASLKKELDFARMSLGLNPSPFDSWLITRGIKTLELRMRQHCLTGQKIAEFFQDKPKVNRVYYPGLASHSGHEIAKQQMRGFGGIVSVEFSGSGEEVKRMLSKLKIFSLAESLGGVESLVNHPVSMTHASIPEDVRKKMGITDGVVRFSCGIEDADDLIEDLREMMS